MSLILPASLNYNLKYTYFRHEGQWLSTNAAKQHLHLASELLPSVQKVPLLLLTYPKHKLRQLPQTIPALPWMACQWSPSVHSFLNYTLEFHLYFSYNPRSLLYCEIYFSLLILLMSNWIVSTLVSLRTKLSCASVPKPFGRHRHSDLLCTYLGELLDHTSWCIHLLYKNVSGLVRWLIV